MKPRRCPCPWAKAARRRAVREGAKLLRELKALRRGIGPAKPADWPERVTAAQARRIAEGIRRD